MPIKITDGEIAAMKRFLRGLKKNIRLGCTDDELAQTMTALREIRDHFLMCWRYVGLTGNPLVESQTFIDKEINGDAIYLLFGALEPHGVVNGPIIFAKAEDGSVSQLEGPSGCSWFSYGDPKERVMGPDFAKARAFVIRDYFFSPIAIVQGQKVSRTAILDYVAYELGYIHITDGRWRKNNANIASTIDAIQWMPINKNRTPAEYMALCIADEISNSSAVSRFGV